MTTIISLKSQRSNIRTLRLPINWILQFYVQKTKEYFCNKFFLFTFWLLEANIKMDIKDTIYKIKIRWIHQTRHHLCCIKFLTGILDSIYVLAALAPSLCSRQGCPKKKGDPCLRAIEGTRSGLKTKVGWVLENSGNFLSNEHKNTPFLWKNGWEI